ncbi:MAG TPA: AAA family ATPase [Gemmatimonadales bacterium]|jgi:hypothetical protein
MDGKPLLLFLLGPPAVGKMTVGTEVARRTGLKLFHNHQTIEFVLPYFAFGTAPFFRLVNEFRQRVFHEVAASDLPGLVFTYCWAFDQPGEDVTVAQYSAPFVARGGRVLFAELQATQDERLRRNATPFRLSQKPSKRDVAGSAERLRLHDTQHQFDSKSRFAGRADYLRLETTHLPAEDVAERVVAHFGLGVENQ